MPSRGTRLLLNLLALSVPALAGDTTYSETRSIPRESTPRSSSGDGTSTGEPAGSTVGSWDGWDLGSDEEDDPRIPNWNGQQGQAGWMKSCLEPGDNLGAVLIFPLQMGFCFTLYGLATSHAHLFAGDAEMDTFRSRPWRFGLGFGLGALWMPEAAGGPPASFHVEALHVLSPAHQVSLRTAFRAGSIFPTRDYARTARVDGIPIGDEIDRLSGYSLMAVPMLLEYHRTGSAGLSLTLGAGAAWISEEVWLSRSWTWRNGGENKVESRVNLLPAFSAAIARFGSRDGRVGRRFAIRYQAEWLRPDRRSSFPGDNTEVAHTLTWDWSWLL